MAKKLHRTFKLGRLWIGVATWRWSVKYLHLLCIGLARGDHDVDLFPHYDRVTTSNAWCELIDMRLARGFTLNTLTLTDLGHQVLLE